MNETINEKVAANGIFTALLIGAITSSLLQTSLTTALPSIMYDFKISASTGQWLTSAYTMSMGIMIPVSPFLLRRFKTKTVSLAVIGAIIIGVVLAAVSWNFPMLLIGRIIQGLSTGVLLSMVQIVILTIYPVEKRGTMMGIYGLAACAAPVLAPTITGILIDLISWRAIFALGFIIAIVDFILLAVVMKNILTNEVQSFDACSMILCAIGFCGILIGCGNFGSFAFISTYVALPLFIGIAALVVFCIKQLKMKKAFLELHTFRNNVFTMAVIMSMLTYCVLAASSTLFPMYLQIVYGLSATVCGLVMMPGSFISALISPFSGKIYDRFGIRKLAIVGSLFSVLSCFFISLLTESTPIVIIIIIFIIQMIAVGCTMMPLITWGMSTLGERYTSDGTAIINMLRTIAGAIGSALLVAVMTYVTKVSSGSIEVVANAMGMRVTYIGMVIISIIQLVISLLFVGRKE